jgi:hypothetical protein
MRQTIDIYNLEYITRTTNRVHLKFTFRFIGTKLQRKRKKERKREEEEEFEKIWFSLHHS